MTTSTRSNRKSIDAYNSITGIYMDTTVTVQILPCMVPTLVHDFYVIIPCENCINLHCIMYT